MNSSGCSHSYSSCPHCSHGLPPTKLSLMSGEEHLCRESWRHQATLSWQTLCFAPRIYMPEPQRQCENSAKRTYLDLGSTIAWFSDSSESSWPFLNLKKADVRSRVAPLAKLSCFTSCSAYTIIFLFITQLY